MHKLQTAFFAGVLSLINATSFIDFENGDVEKRSLRWTERKSLLCCCSLWFSSLMSFITSYLHARMHYQVLPLHVCLFSSLFSFACRVVWVWFECSSYFFRVLEINDLNRYSEGFNFLLLCVFASRDDWIEWELNKNMESVDCCYRSRYIVLWAGYLKVIPHVAKIFKSVVSLPMIVIVVEASHV